MNKPQPGATPFEGLGLWSFYGSPVIASALAATGCDWLCLDAQHGAFDRASVVGALLAVTPAPCRVAVRVPRNDTAWIGFALDAGADSVIVPLVETAEQAARAASAAYYPPRGGRSWGPLVPLWGADAPTVPDANARPRLAVMIETALALENLDAIATTPGVDMLFVGPFDLALALGIGLDELLSDPAPDAPLRRIVAAAEAAGVALGAFAGSPERGAVLRSLGFGAVAVATDSGSLHDGARRALGSRSATRTSSDRPSY